MTCRPAVLARNRKLARKLAEDNGGAGSTLLPNPWRMIKMGHGALYRYIHRHEDEFGDFEFQEAVGIEDDNSTFNIGIRQEHLATEGDLVKEHGKLPSIKWLGDNGYSKLASYMRIHPDVFMTKSKVSRNGRTNGSGIMLHATAPKSTTSRKRKRK